MTPKILTPEEVDGLETSLRCEQGIFDADAIDLIYSLRHSEQDCERLKQNEATIRHVLEIKTAEVERLKEPKPFDFSELETWGSNSSDCSLVYNCPEPGDYSVTLRHIPTKSVGHVRFVRSPFESSEVARLDAVISQLSVVNVALRTEAYNQNGLANKAEAELVALQAEVSELSRAVIFGDKARQAHEDGVLFVCNLYDIARYKAAVAKAVKSQEGK